MTHQKFQNQSNITYTLTIYVKPLFNNCYVQCDYMIFGNTNPGFILKSKSRNLEEKKNSWMELTKEGNLNLKLNTKRYKNFQKVRRVFYKVRHTFQKNKKHDSPKISRSIQSYLPYDNLSETFIQ